jgi:hypothetical protein
MRLPGKDNTRVEYYVKIKITGGFLKDEKSDPKAASFAKNYRKSYLICDFN